MKKTIKFFTIFLIIIFLFVTHINVSYAVIDEIKEIKNESVENSAETEDVLTDEDKNKNQNEEKNEISNELNNDITSNDKDSNIIENKVDENVIENEVDNNNIDNTIESEDNSINTNQSVYENEIVESNIEEQYAKGIDLTSNEIIQNNTINEITTKLTGRAVGIDGGSNSDGASINLWDNANARQQKFIFEYNEDGYYEIINQKSRKLLDVVGSGMTSGTRVDQWKDNGGFDNQKWIIEKTEDGYYNIISKLNGLYLTVNGTGANCDLLCVTDATGSDNQKFMIIQKGTISDEQPVEDGTYKIVLANAPTQSLTVDGGKTSDGANVHIWKYANTSQQQFELKYDGNGYYAIIPIHSGKRIDIAGRGNEANVDQWSDNGGNENQKWAIVKSASGNYNLISQRQNLYLDAYRSGTADGTNIEVYEKSGGIGQEFKLQKIEIENIVGEKTVEDGTYKIVLANAPTQSLTVDGGKTSDGANVHIWEYLNTPQQQFNLVYDGDGYYEIIPIHSGKRLDIAGSANEANVDQWSNNGGNDNQKWVIRESASGNYNIISKRKNLYLDAYASGTQNGTNIQVYEKSEGNGQEFKLEKIENKSEKTVANDEYKVLPKLNKNMVVEASASNTDNNGRLQIWDNFNLDAQRLNFEYENGFYKITLKHSGKSLTVKDNNFAEGTDVVQYDYQGLDSQKWLVRDTGKNGLVISSLTNPALSVTVEGNVENGSKLILSKTDYNDNQLFDIHTTKITIVLNPGHGGSSTGCAHGSIVEKNVTLQIAQKIQANLSKYSDINVILTRTGDYDMDLAPRAMIARNNNADLYVSLHINDEGSHTATGSQMYVPFYEGTNHYNSNMTRLANLIQDKLESIGIKENISGGITKRNIDTIPRYQYLMDGQVVQADYYADIRCAMKGDTLDYGPDLNTNTGVPAILVEHCFMNSSDSQFLDSDYDLQRIADADSSAILEYFGL